MESYFRSIVTKSLFTVLFGFRQTTAIMQMREIDKKVLMETLLHCVRTTTPSYCIIPQQQQKKKNK